MFLPWDRTIPPLIVAVHFRPMTRVSLPTCPESLRPEHVSLRLAAPRPHRCLQIVTTSSNLLTPIVHLRATRGGSRSIPLPSNALFARRNSRVPTISDRIYGLTPTSVLLFVLFAVKHSLANMIGRGMKVCIAERRSSSAVASSVQEAAGAVAAVSLVRTLWVDISVVKLAVSASSPYSTKKPWSGSANMTSR